MMQKLDVPNRLVLLYCFSFIAHYFDIITTKIAISNGAIEANIYARWLFEKIGFNGTILFSFICFVGVIVLSEVLLWGASNRLKGHNFAKTWFKIIVLFLWIVMLTTALCAVMNNLAVLAEVGF